MAKREEGQTIQWPKEKKDRQYNGQKRNDKRTKFYKSLHRIQKID